MVLEFIGRGFFPRGTGKELKRSTSVASYSLHGFFQHLSLNSCSIHVFCLDYWEPKLARLNYSGTYNAWSTTMETEELPWIQV